MRQQYNLLTAIRTSNGLIWESLLLSKVSKSLYHASVGDHTCIEAVLISKSISASSSPMTNGY
ncbi:uncharacterized protein PHALS_12312 [Plasmopara halstedii]|uniref:Uncharacterized protein n=1 Tax=Plasmopara halstedii TaxID=4781 RepID=A0A0P1ALX4_PLAHL|nr:uncharacterized protein PHALS_12312 [Plasmopara halstedii]CEG42005.1 hypothetical protein PHALS_12312 [Plasmopara halstedii]|eukprot:XP_024578374.1 hypothetical protein PHALS_12312 [Plasmopara halstedii]